MDHEVKLEDLSFLQSTPTSDEPVLFLFAQQWKCVKGRFVVLLRSFALNSIGVCVCVCGGGGGWKAGRGNGGGGSI